MCVLYASAPPPATYPIFILFGMGDRAEKVFVHGAYRQDLSSCQTGYLAQQPALDQSLCRISQGDIKRTRQAFLDFEVSPKNYIKKKGHFA